MKILLSGTITAIKDLRNLKESEKRIYTLELTVQNFKVNHFGKKVVDKTDIFCIDVFLNVLEFDTTLCSLECECYCELNGRNFVTTEGLNMNALSLRLLEINFDL